MRQRPFPGRLTLEQWLAKSFFERLPLAWRAQCDLLGSFRHCANKRCRRHRTCRGADPESCQRRLSRLKKVHPKVLRRELYRLEQLAYLRRGG